MCIERGSNPERKSNIRDIKKRHFLYLTGGWEKVRPSKPIESPHTIHDPSLSLLIWIYQNPSG